MHGLLASVPPASIPRLVLLQQFRSSRRRRGCSAQGPRRRCFAVALAECCFDTGGLGAEVDVPPAAADHGLVTEATLFWGVCLARHRVGGREPRRGRAGAPSLRVSRPPLSGGREVRVS